MRRSVQLHDDQHWNTFVREGIWINRVAGQFVLQPLSRLASDIGFQPLHADTDALFIASNSTIEMSLMECGHPGNALFMWTRRGSLR